MYNLDDNADDAENTVRHNEPVKEGFGCLSPDEEDDGSVGGEDEAAGQGVGEEDGGQGVVVIAGAVLHNGETQVFSQPKVCGDENFFHYVFLNVKSLCRRSTSIADVLYGMNPQRSVLLHCSFPVWSRHNIDSKRSLSTV